MIGFKPQKATDLDNLAAVHKKKLYSKSYVCSRKYDGHQVWISKEGQRIRFFTSDWKEFFISSIAYDLLESKADFLLIGELLFNCVGKLGSRKKSAITTTFRTNYLKGLPNDNRQEKLVKIMLFDCLYHRDSLEKLYYSGRLEAANVLASYSDQIEVIHHFKNLNFTQCQDQAKTWFDEGWEGAVIHEMDAKYVKGKRAPWAIKLKFRKTADLLCVGVEAGQGKCEGIGALVLSDSKGRIVKVGSGLDYSKSTREGSSFIGKVIEIEYEQIMETYIQPSFVCIREDKTPEEID